ncbi:MAG: molybdenum cofactor biosynthesis protein MoaE [Planctomycetes bacterium]|nr:molybdenum cofactor biosynthesis protein MoaE [Planctomycetota bacterium]
MIIRLQRAPIALEELVRAVSSPASGAVVTFTGTVRDSHHGRQVLRLEYAAYDEMALSELRRIAETIAERWQVAGIAIVHRLGLLEIGETSVAIVLALPHRRDGFEALRFAIDSLKESVPIWKKEFFAGGEAVWVEGS